jgi:hypothetical protein
MCIIQTNTIFSCQDPDLAHPCEAKDRKKRPYPTHNLKTLCPTPDACTAVVPQRYDPPDMLQIACPRCHKERFKGLHRHFEEEWKHQVKYCIPIEYLEKRKHKQRELRDATKEARRRWQKLLSDWETPPREFWDAGGLTYNDLKDRGVHDIIQGYGRWKLKSIYPHA